MRTPNLKRLAAALLLGLCATVGVAWALALTDITETRVGSSQRILPTRGEVEWPLAEPQNGITVTHAAGPGRIALRSWCYGPKYVPYLGTRLSITERTDMPPEKLVPASMRALTLPWLHGAPWPKSTDTEWREVEASGWPRLALAHERRVGPNFTTEDRFGIKLERKRQVGAERFFVSRDVACHLPLYPLWRGLFIDTIVYAAPWWLFLTIATMALGRWRAKRGHCPKCRYDLRGLNSPRCPECGAAR